MPRGEQSLRLMLVFRRGVEDGEVGCDDPWTGLRLRRMAATANDEDGMHHLPQQTTT